jgi:hypothetical protein
MASIPKNLTYEEFKYKVGDMIKNKYEIYNLVIERLGGKFIKTYQDFLGNLGNTRDIENIHSYWDLYSKLYSENENVIVNRPIRRARDVAGAKRKLGISHDLYAQPWKGPFTASNEARYETHLKMLLAAKSEGGNITRRRKGSKRKGSLKHSLQ